MQNDEQTHIEEEFRVSWDRLEGFFGDGYDRGYSDAAIIISLIREIKRLGYERHFYASFANNKLSIYRSSQTDSPKSSIDLSFGKSGELALSANINEQKTEINPYTCFPNAISPEFKALLELLMLEPIE